MNQIIGYLRAWIKRENAELQIDTTFHFSWLELITICGIIGFAIYLI